MSELSRRSFLASAGATVAAVLGGPILLRRPGALAAPPVAPRLAYGVDAARSMTVAWSTTGDASGIAADVGVDDAFGLTAPIETREVAGHPGVLYHRAAFDGLAPGTAYRYRLAHDGSDAATGTFRTAPVERSRFRFAALGDQGTGDRAVAVNSSLTARHPDLVFLVGDLCYASLTGGVLPAVPGVTGVNHAVWDEWLALTSAAGAASVPWLAGVGNHEIEDGLGELGYDGYLARVPLPGNGPAGVPTAWWARHGSVAFVNLDANDASLEIDRIRGWTAGAQDAWLDGLLGSLRADPGVDWIVVGFHHCAYCTNALHASDGGVRERWEPLFDRHAVDLVVNGHNHCYERTHPLRGGAQVGELAAGGTLDSTTGTTYVTAGGGGQTGYPASLAPVSYVSVSPVLKEPEAAAWSAFRYNDNSAIVVDVDPGEPGGVTTLAVTAFDSAGADLERFTLVRARAAAPAARAPAAAPPGAATASPAPSEVASSGATIPATGGDRSGLAIAAAATTAAVALHAAGRRAAG